MKPGNEEFALFLWASATSLLSLFGPNPFFWIPDANEFPKRVGVFLAFAALIHVSGFALSIAKCVQGLHMRFAAMTMVTAFLVWVNTEAFYLLPISLSAFLTYSLTLVWLFGFLRRVTIPEMRAQETVWKLQSSTFF